MERDPEPSKNNKRAACTIIARNYLAQARVLADSYLEYETSGRFFLLVVDGLPEGVQLNPAVTVLGPDDIGIPDFVETSFKYEITELCTAVKPAFMSVILKQYDVEQLVFFDPDIAIFRPLDEMWELLAESNIVLIPHLLDSIPLDGKHPSEQDILIAGAYNLGFIGLHASAETARMLDWWGERLREHCRIDIPNGLFVDQKWIDLAPSLFDRTAILRDATYDVAYWNLHSRDLERDGNAVLVNGRPLAFFHFSGFNPSRPRELSKHQNRLAVADSTPLAYLLDNYSKAVERLGFALTRTWPYRYAAFDNGIAIHSLHRHLYISLDPERRHEFGDPFQTDGPQSFFQWACRPSSSTDGGVSRFLERLLVESEELRTAFPEARGRQHKAFLTWAQTFGVERFGYDPRLADPTAWPELTLGSGLSHTNGVAGRPEGVNVYGYLRNETGIGAVARGFIGALRATGVPLGLTDLAALSPNRSQDATLQNIDATAPYAINLVCVNADQHFIVKSHVGEDAFNDHYNIGVWFWELPTFPAEWLDRFEDYDEIWAPSAFIATTLAAVSPIPIVRITPVLVAPQPGLREAGRRHLGVGPETFVFLFIFDFASYFERKNPVATIQAFTQAFAPDDDVQLVIKCVNEHLDLESFASMQEAAGEHPVAIHSGYWTAQEMRDLMAACDAYVSLHHSEGLGLTIADAMALGKPVIATAWSGNTDFMTVSNSFPVSFELVELREDSGPYRAGAVWAEPSIDDAVRLMRLVRDDPEVAQARGQAARRDLDAQYSESRVGEVLLRRLAMAARKQRLRGSSRLQARAAESLPAPGLPVPSVPPMELTDSSHGRLGVVVKRGMNFLLRYHTHYQGEINLAFAGFLRQVQTEHEAHARQLAAARQEIAAIRQENAVARQGLGAARQQIAALEAQLQATVKNLGTTTATVARLDGYFASRPYMAHDDYGSGGDLNTPMGFGLGLQDPAAMPTVPEFGDLFRGPEDFIGDRQRVYLSLFKGMSKVIDLGSGRGEFLEILREQTIDAIGVDLDPVLVDRCVKRGLHAEHADAFDYLKQTPEGSVDVIFSAQFIEHVESNRLLELLELAHSRLRDKGLFIAETVNPESYLAMKTFFVDLTHQRPIYPQVLLHICQTVGYSSARIFYPTAGGFTQKAYSEAGEYAVVAVK